MDFSKKNLTSQDMAFQETEETPSIHPRPAPWRDHESLLAAADRRITASRGSRA